MRRTIDVTIRDEGRDQGKVFRITEMPAAQAEEWAMRAIMALTKAGVDIPSGATGMAGIATAGLQALGTLNFGEVKPLLDEMFACIERIPNPKETNVIRKLVDTDTEEVSTRLKLRAEVWTLHTGFSFAGPKSKDSTSATTAGPSSALRMSRRHSRQLSPRS